MSDVNYSPVSVNNKTAVVIGGTSGIGRAIALGFAADGAEVIATSRSKTRVEEVTAELQTLDVEAGSVTCDVTDSGSLTRFWNHVEAELGTVDILVYSAGTAARLSAEDLEESDWHQVLEVNLTGVFRVCQQFRPLMDTGSVISISSIAARLARADLSPYLASKAGVEGLTRALAREYSPQIRVNAIAPGFVLTPLAREAYEPGSPLMERIKERTPMNRMASPEEIVGAAIYLGSDASSFTTGSVLTVDGGFAENAL